MTEGRLKVVLVDDAAELRQVLRLQLRVDGRFDVAGEGASGHDAVALASRHRPDVMLLDASMPVMDGLEAIPEILAASPSTRIIMLSGFEEEGLRAKAAQLGAVAYIEKSRPIAELPQAVIDAIEGASPGPAASSTSTAGPGGEDVLAEHLERFRTVFEQAAIGMATVTLSGTIVRANAALAALTGVPQEDLIGTRYSALADDADADALLRALALAVDSPKAAINVEHRLCTTDRVAWATTTFSAIADSRGAPLYVFAQTADVTARHETVEALRVSEERFRLMVESVQDYAIFMLDPGGHVTTWNTGAQRLKGYTAEEIIGQHFRTFYPEEPRARRHPEHELELAVRDGRYEEEGWRVRKDGSQFWANVVITALFDDDGRHVGFAKVTRDMTDRRAAEEALRISEERFRLMVESVQDYAIFMLDPDGYVTTWNVGAQRVNGYSAHEIIGKHFRTFYPAEARARRHPEHELELAVRDGRYEEEGWRVRKDGSTLWANVVITALFDSDGRHVGFAKVTRDTTERRLAEQARDRAAEHLAATNERLDESIRQTEDFLAITAHELQSPIAVMTGAADILRDHWEQLDHEERVESLARISSGGARIRRLLTDLLTASRLQAGAFRLSLEPTDLASIVHRALQEVDATVSAVTAIDVPPTPLLADPARLTQVLTNLLNNAARYGRPPITVTARTTGPMVELRVSDAGPGISPDLRPRLFEKFERGGATERKGSGLGLYIVRELARAHGGDAHYEPVAAGGATFVIELPATEAGGATSVRG